MLFSPDVGGRGQRRAQGKAEWQTRENARASARWSWGAVVTSATSGAPCGHSVCPQSVRRDADQCLQRCARFARACSTLAVPCRYAEQIAVVLPCALRAAIHHARRRRCSKCLRSAADGWLRACCLMFVQLSLLCWDAGSCTGNDSPIHQTKPELQEKSCDWTP